MSQIGRDSESAKNISYTGFTAVQFILLGEEHYQTLPSAEVPGAIHHAFLRVRLIREEESRCSIACLS
jgi:hypothetical protein